MRASAFMRGDMDGPATRIADDFTRLQPFGGEASRGFDVVPERLARLASYFRNGDAKVELVQSYASGDLAVLAVIQREHGEVGGLPDQDWSLRVTLVIAGKARTGGGGSPPCDPLVRDVGLEERPSAAGAISAADDVLRSLPAPAAGTDQASRSTGIQVGSGRWPRSAALASYATRRARLCSPGA